VRWWKADLIAVDGIDDTDFDRFRLPASRDMGEGECLAAAKCVGPFDVKGNIPFAVWGFVDFIAAAETTGVLAVATELEGFVAVVRAGTGLGLTNLALGSMVSLGEEGVRT
jgi:hypothetical protein